MAPVGFTRRVDRVGVFRFGEFRALLNQAASPADFADPGGQLFGVIQVVGKNQPALRGQFDRFVLGLGLPNLACHGQELCFPAFRPGQARQAGRLGKAALAQHLFPTFAGQQRVIGPQVGIGHAPPTRGESENGFGPRARRRHVDKSQRPAGGEQAVKMSQRGAQIGCGVQDVCADDEVERSFVETLLERFAIQIECPVFDFREVSQFLLGRRKERG